MNDNPISKSPGTKRQEQAASLRNHEAQLQELAARGNKEQFFKEITPLLGHLKSYIRRLLRAGYLEREISTPVYTSGDILDQAILKAYDNFAKKPAGMTLEQWLYQLVNETLTNYLQRRKSIDRKRKSLEALNQAELRTLEEVEHITADTEGEVQLDEDLDDAELYEREFTPPLSEDDPEKALERKEEVERIMAALAQLPEEERLVFELAAIEGFSNEEVGRILNMPASEVERIKAKARQKVLRELQSPAVKKAS